jgi:hypothetical protein
MIRQGVHLHRERRDASTRARTAPHNHERLQCRDQSRAHDQAHVQLGDSIREADSEAAHPDAQGEQVRADSSNAINSSKWSRTYRRPPDRP